MSLVLVVTTRKGDDALGCAAALKRHSTQGEKVVRLLLCGRANPEAWARRVAAAGKKATVVYTPHPRDSDPRRRTAAQAVLAALNARALAAARLILAYETPGAAGLTPFRPEVFVGCEASHPLALVRGATAGLPAAEAFELIREIS